MSDQVQVVPDVHAAERTADMAAEAAYLAQQSAGDDDVADEETPAPKDTPKTKTPAAPVVSEDSAVEEPSDDADADEEETDDADQPEQPGEEEDDAQAEDEEEDDFDSPKASAPEDEFTSALEEHGVKIKLDDIKDPVARKFIETRLKELNAGFTRAMQDARSYRKDEIAFKAEQRFQKEHPVDHLVSLLLADPTLGEQVNTRLEEMESPTARRAHDVVVRDAKAQARSAEETASNRQAQRAERGTQVERYAMRAAEKAGVPYELGIPEAIVALVLSRGDDGDVTRAEVDGIIKNKADRYQRSIRAHKREARKAYIAQKTEDAKTGGLKIKPGSGSAPGVGKKKVPANDEEFVASFEG